tara:strand:- start:2203 stop:2787 length:585 start_codon:yes stop_codon:yes gene_type:complete
VKKIFFFSNNPNKIKEVLQILKNDLIKIKTLKKLDIKAPNETGKTFYKNANIKSSYGYKLKKIPCFADDSGICIDALDGKPGVNSKDYIHINGGSEKTFKKIINKSKKLLNTKAFFITVISLTLNGEKTIFFEGKVKGNISSTPRGKNGFGYDPIFIPNGFKKTFAEMTTEEKNSVSHRRIALFKLQKYLFKSF